MTREQLIQLFPLLEPSLVIAKHTAAISSDSCISVRTMFLLGVQEWLTHLGFLRPVEIADIHARVERHCASTEDLQVMIIDHNLCIFGPRKFDATTATMRPQFLDIPTGVPLEENVYRLLHAETVFTLYTLPMMKRLKEERGKIEKAVQQV